MKYLKKMNESTESSFHKLSRSEWAKIINEMVSLNEVRVKQIPSEFNPEIKKTGVQRDNYATAKINGLTVFIYALPDEYYGVFTNTGLNSGADIFFKCDQIDGLVGALEFIKSSVKSIKSSIK